MEALSWLHELTNLGFAAAIYVAIRMDLKYVKKSVEDHEDRIRKVEHKHG